MSAGSILFLCLLLHACLFGVNMGKMRCHNVGAGPFAPAPLLTPLCHTTAVLSTVVEHCTVGGGRIQAAVGTQGHQLWWCGGWALVVVGVTQTPMLLTCCGVTRHSVVVDRILRETLWMAAAVFRGGVHTCWLFLHSACLSALLGCVGVALASLICCWQELCAAARLDVAPHSTFLDG